MAVVDCSGEKKSKIQNTLPEMPEDNRNLNQGTSPRSENEDATLYNNQNNDNDNKHGSNGRRRFSPWKIATIAGVGVAGAAASTVVIPGALAVAGFSAGGIAAGSVAASAMSTAATTGWGMVLVSTAQSIGAAGLGWIGTLTAGTATAATTAVIRGVKKKSPSEAQAIAEVANN